MAAKEILYSFEHELLPEAFFNDRQGFLSMLLQGPNELHSIIDNLFKLSGQENPFSPSEFGVEPNMVNADVASLKLKFPKPPEAPLCLASYVFFDRTFEKVSYFCIEKGDEASGGFPNVCRWEEDGTHVTYGSESYDPDEQFIRCVNIHMERYYKEEEE